jgi:hypothetical protein
LAGVEIEPKLYEPETAAFPVEGDRSLLVVNHHWT